MRSPRWTLLLAGLIVAACTTDTGEEAPPDVAPATLPAQSADEQALEQLRASFVEHYNQQHASVVADLYTDSAFGLWADGSVDEGRAELLADLEEELAGAPTLGLSTRESMVIGDHAVALGDYTVDVTMENAPLHVAGTYMTYFQRVDGQWKIAGVITNYGAPAPEGMPEPEEEETPADEGTMQALASRYTEAFNASDWDAVAALHTDDAVVAYSEAPPLEGAAAVRARLTELFGADAAPTIVIHDVGTADLGDGWALDGGWYTLTATTADGAIVQDGIYMSLLQRQPDGSWKIHWSVTNGSPEPAA